MSEVVQIAVPVVITGLFAIAGTWLTSRRLAKAKAADRASTVVREHRDPLLRAAYELQSRVYNIAVRRYLAARTDTEFEQARLTTLWIFGQYFGQAELLRRELQFLDMGSSAINRAVQRGLHDIATVLSSDLSRSQSPIFSINRSEQRAAGEFMLITRDDAADRRTDLLGYGEFAAKLGSHRLFATAKPTDQPGKRWFGRSRDDPDSTAVAASPALAWLQRFGADLQACRAENRLQEGKTRLVLLQRNLVDLINLLDPDRIRYPNQDHRGKIPLPSDAQRDPAEVACFLWRFQPDARTIVDRWTKAQHLTPANGAERCFTSRRGLLGCRVCLVVRYDEDLVTIRAWRFRLERRRLPIGSDLRSARARRVVNHGLAEFDRPLILGNATLAARGWAALKRACRRLAPAPMEHGS